MMKTIVVYTSMTGNTETFIDFIKENVGDNITITNDLSTDLSEYDKIIIGSYTWGGRIPGRMKIFLVNNKNNFKGKDIFIFGSGNSIYPKYCRAVDNIEKIISDCGGIVKGTFKFEQRFNKNDFIRAELKYYSQVLSCFGD